MDGRHHILQVAEDGSLSVVQTFYDHSKYVVKSRWFNAGNSYMTASHDKTVNVYCMNEEMQMFEKNRTLYFKTPVESIACTMGDGSVLVVGVRDDNYLHYFRVDENFDEFRVNMNELGDDHVSFTAMDLAVSPCNRMLLVATDRPRLILFRLGTSQILRNFYGHTEDSLGGQVRSCRAALVFNVRTVLACTNTTFNTHNVFTVRTN
jgi:COMPASS component SWD3